MPENTTEDLYAVLGVVRSCTPDQIRDAFRRLAMENHPDKCPNDPLAGARFIRIRQAYETLIDPESRAAHDRRCRVVGTTGYWIPDIRVTISMSYYGYDVPMEVIQKAAKDSASEPEGTQAQAMARFILDPFLTRTKKQLAQKPNDLELMLTMADLCFHTFRSYQSLEWYVLILRTHHNWEAAAQCVHLERAFHYSGDDWGAVRMFTTLLKTYPQAPWNIANDWREDGLRALKNAERGILKDTPKESRLDLLISFMAKKEQFGYRPINKDYRRVIDSALAAKRSEVALDYLARLNRAAMDMGDITWNIRILNAMGRHDEAIALGESIITPEALTRTLNADYRSVCRVLAEVYEESDCYQKALGICKKLARYADASTAIKESVKRLESKCAASSLSRGLPS